MPDQYNATEGRTLVLIPEESAEEENMWQAALTATTSRGGTPPLTGGAHATEAHNEIDDGTIGTIIEGD